MKRLVEFVNKFKNKDAKSSDAEHLVEIVTNQNELGRGYAGKVLTALYKGEKIAVKSLHQTDDETKALFAKELEFHRNFTNSPNVVRFIVALPNGTGIGMELMTGGEFFTRLTEPMTVAEFKGYFTQIAVGLSHIHQAKIIHRDLKGENVLIAKDGTLKISDFGLSVYANEFGVGNDGSCCGSPDYVDPLVLTTNNFTYSSDGYALGIMMSVPLSGGWAPFGGVTVNDLIYGKTHCNLEPYMLSPNVMAKVEPNAAQLVANLCSYNQKNRPTTLQTIEAIRALPEPVVDTAPSVKAKKTQNIPAAVMNSVDELDLSTPDMFFLKPKGKEAPVAALRKDDSLYGFTLINK